MTVSGLKDWMVYSESDQTIIFKDITEEKVGVYNLKFTLFDSLGAENIVVTTFEVKIPEVEGVIEETVEEE